VNSGKERIRVPSNSRCWRYYQEDLEKLFGVSRKTLYRWEKDGILVRSDIRSILDLYIRKNVKRLDVLRSFWEELDYE